MFVPHETSGGTIDKNLLYFECFFLISYLTTVYIIQSGPENVCHKLTLVVFVYRLTDTQFKLDALDKDPYALDTLARPLPFRG